MAFGDRATAPSQKAKRPKVKKAAEAKGKGPRAPKPQGVFAAPVKAPSVKPAKPQPQKPPRTASALDVLPTKKGRAPKPYQPAPATKVVAKVQRARAKAQHEARDTKGDTERAQVDAYKRTDAYLQAVKDASAGRQKPSSGFDTANRTTKILPLATQKDRPRSDAELRRFLATGERPVRKGSRENLKIENQVLPVQLLRRTVSDYVDLEANAIPSTYKLAKDAVTDPKKAASEVAQPYIDTFRSPKAFGHALVTHPGYTALLLAGVRGAAGHSVGKALRTAPSETLRKAGSTARAVESPGNIKAAADRPYSKDAIVKAGQVAKEKTNARRAKRRGEPVPRHVLSEKDIARRVDQEVAVGKTVTSHNEAKARKAAEKALGKKPSAITSAVAQGIVDGSVADVSAYIRELTAEAKHLSGDSLKRNEDTRALLTRALKTHDPAITRSAAAAYEAVRAPGEAETVARGIVDPDKALQTRYAGAKVRGKSDPVVKAARRAANKDLRVAKDEAAATAARLATAKVEAEKWQVQRDSNGVVIRRGVPPKQADELRSAIDAADAARQRVVAAKRVAVDAQNAHLIARANGRVTPSYVSHAPGGDVRPAAVPTTAPRLAITQNRAGQAIKQGSLDLHPDRLIKQAGDSQRRLDAANNYESYLDTFAYRASKGAKVETRGGKSAAESLAQDVKDMTGMDWVPARGLDGKYRIVPKVAQQRLVQHAAKSDHTLAAFTRLWSKNVLAFSPRWLAGQAIEPGVRAAIAHAGPRSYVTGAKVLKRIEQVHGPEAAVRFKARALPGGIQTVATRDLEHVGAQKEYAGLAKTVRELPKKPGPKQLGQVYNAVTNFTLGTLNHVVQTPSQYAMLGKAIRDSDLMSAHTVKLTNDAINDFVRNGGNDVNVQARLGREVQRMNGKYNGFSPKVQALIAGYTPFLAWTLSATNFLFNVLPRDHPVLTSLLASASLATENWRKANGLQYDPFRSGQEGWLQGSIPGAGGSHLRVGRYVPFGLANDDAPFIGPYASAVLPQASGVLSAAKGEDWMGHSLTGAHGPKPSLARIAAAGGSSVLSGVVPLASQVLHVAGVRTPDMADNAKIKPALKARVRSQFDPFMYTPGHGAPEPGPRGNSGSGGLPAGVSQAELDRLVRDAQKAASQPQVSQKEIDALLKSVR